MKILITGGTGFVGSNLAKHFSKDNKVVITGSKREQELDVKTLDKNIQWKKLGSIDALFHQAAINDTLLNDAEVMNKFNVEYSKKLFNNAVENGCKKIVYASSTAAYGDVEAPYKEQGPFNPLNAYGRSKLMLDWFAMDFARDNPDILVVGLCYCNVYGPGENHKGKRASMIYQLAQQIKKDNVCKLFKWGEQKRDHIYVKDVVRANELALNSEKSGILNCGYGMSTSFNELVELLNLIMETDARIEYKDNPNESSYQNFTECDMSLAEEKIGFVPKYNIAEGIKDYYLSGKLVD